MLGVTDDRQVAVLTLACRAARRRPALVARFGDVLEVRAAGALEQVATDRGQVSDLPRCSRQQRLAENRVVAPDSRVGGEIRVADRGADAQSTAGELLDLRQRQAGDVDQLVWPRDLQ